MHRFCTAQCLFWSLQMKHACSHHGTSRLFWQHKMQLRQGKQTSLLVWQSWQGSHVLTVCIKLSRISIIWIHEMLQPLQSPDDKWKYKLARGRHRSYQSSEPTKLMLENKTMPVELSLLAMTVTVLGLKCVHQNTLVKKASLPLEGTKSL